MTEPLFERPLPVDWFRLLADLSYAGHCNAAVAQALAIPESTLRHYKEGKTPRHEAGEALCLYYVHTLNRPIPRLIIQIPANLYA